MRRITLASITSIMALMLAASVAFAAIWTDHGDYTPGSTVTISGDNSDGAGYLAGETVNVDVTGPHGYSASCETIADEEGAWSCSVTLWDGESAVGDYSYTATGLMSGVSEAGGFSDNGQSGTTLSADVTVTPHWTITYHWTIDKSVTPDSWDLFTGDSGISQYTIAVTNDAGTEEAWVDGQVCVTNGGDFATQNLAITAVLQDGYGPPNDFLTSAPVDVSGYPVIPAGGNHCYTYRVDIPITGGTLPQPHAGGTYKVTADVTITNHSGHLGTPFGPSPSATTVCPASPTHINDTINVDDTNGGSWQFSDDGSVQYSKTFTCDADEGTHDNTATIRETGQSDDASVDVNCYALEVTKDADTSFTRTYGWTIDKSADQTALTLSTGQQFLVNYSIKVDATYTDSEWAASGGIDVHNPAPIVATLNSLSDLVSPDIAATVDCGVTFPYSLAAGGMLECTYSASLLDDASRTNTATVTLQNYSYDKDGNGTASGTTDFSGTADVDFSSATMNEMDECIDVSDTYAGSLGEVCVGDAPKTFTYTRGIGPYDACGDYTVENTASFEAGDTGADSSDGWTVSVSVPCAGGCTLTQGYWKTHNNSFWGGAPPDDAWLSLGNLDGDNGEEYEGEDFFLSNDSWFRVFWTAPQGNAYYQLAHQYMAAYLNILNGADGSAVSATMTAAEGLLKTYTPAQVAALKGNNQYRKQFIDLAGFLGDYNEGLIGPGHCDEDRCSVP
jgi:hypothetical protein